MGMGRSGRQGDHAEASPPSVNSSRLPRISPLVEIEVAAAQAQAGGGVEGDGSTLALHWFRD